MISSMKLYLLHTMSSVLLKFRCRANVSFSAHARLMLKNNHSIHTTIAEVYFDFTFRSEHKWGNEMRKTVRS